MDQANSALQQVGSALQLHAAAGCTAVVHSATKQWQAGLHTRFSFTFLKKTKESVSLALPSLSRHSIGGGGDPRGWGLEHM